MNEMEKLCRICSENETSGEMLFEPCACAGSIAQVHVSCLERWIFSRPGYDAVLRERDGEVTDTSGNPRFICETCRHPYRVVAEPQFVCSCRKLCSFVAVGHFCEMVLMIMVAVLCVVMWPIIIHFSEESHNFLFGSKTADISVTAIISAIVVLATIFTIRKVWRRWVRACSVIRIHPINPKQPHRLSEIELLHDNSEADSRRTETTYLEL
eukprot:266960_1